MLIFSNIYANKSIWILGDYSVLFSSCYIQNHLYICIVIKTEKDSIMETTANTYDDIITRSYEEYYQVILTYITSVSYTHLVEQREATC